MYIEVFGSANTKAKVIVKGKVTLNSNGGVGIDIINPISNLEINVESSGATLETCGNGDEDIGGFVLEPATRATVTFLGDGYTCNQAKVSFDGPGGSTVVEPDCQDCPSS